MHKKLFYMFLLPFIFIKAQDCNGRYQNVTFMQVVSNTVVYGDNVNTSGAPVTLRMDIYEPQGDTASERPVVLLCFGGSFVAGSRTNGDIVYIANSLAARGYVAATIDYRLASSPLELLSEENLVKVVMSAVQDGKAAIRFFRKDAEMANQYRIDVDNIFIGGVSAGGILAVNLAYADSLHKMPSNWQTWVGEIGGLEGNSGNEGYCSSPNGVFSLAGAIGDTAFIDANDVPIYSCHAQGDATVQFGYGPPLNGLAPISLYGSQHIHTRMQHLGIYNSLDEYTGTAHPPYDPNVALLDTTVSNLLEFLYNVLDCNPNNYRQPYQQSCKSSHQDTTDTNTHVYLNHHLIQEAWELYPNPTNQTLFIEASFPIEKYEVINLLGQAVIRKEAAHNMIEKLSISELKKGIYIIKVWSKNKYATRYLEVN